MSTQADASRINNGTHPPTLCGIGQPDTPSDTVTTPTHRANRDADDLGGGVVDHLKALTDAGIALISTTDGIDSSTAAGRMVIGVLASMAEFERELVKERTALKRAASRANGTKFGRRRKVVDASHVATARRMKRDGHTARDVAKYLGVGRATLYRYLAEGDAA